MVAGAGAVAGASLLWSTADHPIYRISVNTDTN